MAEADGLRAIAEECTALVATDHGVTLDWSIDSLTALDDVLHELTADGPLSGERLDLWWKLAGAYTGEVMVAAYGGEWIVHDSTDGTDGVHAVRASGVTAFPFSTAYRILTGEEFKSLASMARALPHIAARAARPDLP